MKGNKFFRNIDRFIGIPLVFLLGIPTQLHKFLTGFHSKNLVPGDHLLVIKLSALGDTLILLPILKALKEKVGPQGQILMIVTEINQSALESFPYVDQIEILHLADFLKHPRMFFTFLKNIRRFKPTLALDFDQWTRISPLLCFICGVSTRYGFKTFQQHRHFLYQKSIRNEKTHHEFEQFASIAELAGIDRLQIEEFNGFLKREKLYPNHEIRSSPPSFSIHIHPGCGPSGWQRAWPEKNYIELIKKLKTKKNIQIQMTGMGSYEENLVHTIIQSSEQKVEDYSGHLEMGPLSELLRKTNLVICGNTGIMHLAVGLGCSVIALHGPTNSIKWGPLLSSRPDGNPIRVLSAQIPCSPCLNLGFDYGCPVRPCMESISVEDTFNEVIRLLPNL